MVGFVALRPHRVQAVNRAVDAATITPAAGLELVERQELCQDLPVSRVMVAPPISTVSCEPGAGRPSPHMSSKRN
jgi:hypothetical protein